MVIVIKNTHGRQIQAEIIRNFQTICINLISMEMEFNREHQIAD